MLKFIKEFILMIGGLVVSIYILGFVCAGLGTALQEGTPQEYHSSVNTDLEDNQ